MLCYCLYFLLLSGKFISSHGWMMTIGKIFLLCLLFVSQQGNQTFRFECLSRNVKVKISIIIILLPIAHFLTNFVFSQRKKIELINCT